MLCLTFDEYYRVPVVLTYMQFSIHVNGDIFTVFFWANTQVATYVHFVSLFLSLLVL